MEFKNNEMIFTEGIIPLQRCSSNNYRLSSNCERQITENIVTNYKSKACELMKNFNITYDEAMRQLDPDWNEHQWTIKPLIKEDMIPGNVFYSNKIPIVCCNSILKDGLYNDTVVLTGDTSLGVSYIQKKNKRAIHSGDIITEYGLRHTIILTNIDKPIDNTIKYWVISTPWVSAQPKSITTLTDTDPVFEIRTFEDEEMTRRVIGQDYSIGGENTACVNACITQEKEDLWKIEIMCHFLPKGFANDLKSLVDCVKLIQ